MPPNEMDTDLMKPLLPSEVLKDQYSTKISADLTADMLVQPPSIDVVGDLGNAEGFCKPLVSDSLKYPNIPSIRAHDHARIHKELLPKAHDRNFLADYRYSLFAQKQDQSLFNMQQPCTTTVPPLKPIMPLLRFPASALMPGSAYNAAMPSNTAITAPNAACTQRTPMNYPPSQFNQYLPYSTGGFMRPNFLSIANPVFVQPRNLPYATTTTNHAVRTEHLAKLVDRKEKYSKPIVRQPGAVDSSKKLVKKAKLAHGNISLNPSSNALSQPLLVKKIGIAAKEHPSPAITKHHSANDSSSISKPSFSPRRVMEKKQRIKKPKPLVKPMAPIVRAEPTGICYGDSLLEYEQPDLLWERRQSAQHQYPEDLRYFSHYQYLRWRYKNPCTVSPHLDPNVSSLGPMVSSASLETGASSRRQKRAYKRNLMSQLFSSGEEVLDGSVADASVGTASSVSKSGMSFKTRSTAFAVKKSPIHSWGLYALESIPANVYVIQYLGEKLKSRPLSILREEDWLRHFNIDSTYLFKLAKDFYIDATMKGSPCRFLNHSCDPNLHSKVVTEELHHSVMLPIRKPQNDLGPLEERSNFLDELELVKVNYTTEDRRVLFYSKRAIMVGEELTFDYKFPREKGGKIPCYCQAGNCHGTLN